MKFTFQQYKNDILFDDKKFLFKAKNIISCSFQKNFKCQYIKIFVFHLKHFLQKNIFLFDPLQTEFLAILTSWTDHQFCGILVQKLFYISNAKKV